MASFPDNVLTSREENDSLGKISIAAECYYGPQTQRALHNFPITGQSIGDIPTLIASLAQVKKAAAITNTEIGELDERVALAITIACDEIIDHKFTKEFVVDVSQGGAGTSTNMNMNEVIANRALEILNFERGRYDVVHPNDHVNRNQSTNDAYATAVRLAVHGINIKYMDALDYLASSFERKVSNFTTIKKLGRTQLQDAVPMTLGQEFGAFAATLREDIQRLEEIGAHFLEINLGGTAIGTGIGSSEKYRKLIITNLADETGLPVKRADNLIEATWDMGAFVLYSSMLKRSASKLSKIANDLRLLSSGPVGGLGEIKLPERQPGSSIMPGKVNPVIPEMVNSIAFRVFGLDTTVTFAAESGQLQLNAFEPVILWSIHESAQLLTKGTRVFADNCIDGIEAIPEKCIHNLVSGNALATELVPIIGYGRSADIAKRALTLGSLDAAVREIAPEISPLFSKILKILSVSPDKESLE